MDRTNKYVELRLNAPIELVKRRYKDSKLPYYRSEFMRDRDRILYSKAYRRLAGKTQVYLAYSNDHQRTRLTHTLEVAQIAKTISSALGLDIDLTEAIALGHDIGHTPFGHAGEQILHQIMTPNKIEDNEKVTPIKRSPFLLGNDKKQIKQYGFKHNWQSVRVAVDLESYCNKAGINLTNYTLYGILNHSNLYYNKQEENIIDNIKQEENNLGYYSYLNKYFEHSKNQNAWSFESYVVEQADEIAQRHHDLDDALRGNLITVAEIIKLIKPLSQITDNENSLIRLQTKKNDINYFIALLSKIIVNMLVTRLIDTSINNLNDLIKIASLRDDSILDWFKSTNESEIKNIIAYDRDGSFTSCLESFTKDLKMRTISSYQIQSMDTKGQYIIRKIFQAYYDNPQQLPDNSVLSCLELDNTEIKRNTINESIDNKGIGYLRDKFINMFKNPDAKRKYILMRAICDYISGMTDKFAVETFNKLYGNEMIF